MPPTKAEIRQAFATFDTDDSGSLSAEELRRVLTRPGGGSPLTEGEAQHLIHKYDDDGDGVLSLDEFAGFLAGEEGAIPPYMLRGDLKEAVQLPAGKDFNEWLAENTVPPHSPMQIGTQVAVPLDSEHVHQGGLCPCLQLVAVPLDSEHPHQG